MGSSHAHEVDDSSRARTPKQAHVQSVQSSTVDLVGREAALESTESASFAKGRRRHGIDRLSAVSNERASQKAGVASSPADQHVSLLLPYVFQLIEGEQILFSPI